MQVHTSRVFKLPECCPHRIVQDYWILEPAMEDYTVYILDGCSNVMQFQQLYPQS